MYTSDPSGQFYSLQYESLTYLKGWLGVGRLISDRMSYRNDYMCSSKATSSLYYIQYARINMHAERLYGFVRRTIIRTHDYTYASECVYCVCTTYNKTADYINNYKNNI